MRRRSVAGGGRRGIARTVTPPRHPWARSFIRRARPNCRSSARLSSSTLTRGSPRRPKVRPSTLRLDHRPDALRRDAARAGDARHLPERAGRREVRVEPARRGGDQLGRHRPGAVGVRLRAGAPRRPAIRSRSFCEVGPRFEPDDARGVVAVAARRRRPRPEVARRGEGLADQLGADHLSAVVGDQAAVGLVREEHLRRRRSWRAGRGAR